MFKAHMRIFVENYLKNNIKKTDIAVDATIGNGNDTLLLTNLASFVYGFDIQEVAIANTNNLLKKHNKNNYRLILDSFENIFTYIKDFKGIVFNLGYLPKGCKTITTTADITVKTLNLITSKMIKDQFIILTCYPNHQEGFIESHQVLGFVKNLNQSFKVLKYKILNNPNKPPFVIVIEKK